MEKFGSGIRDKHPGSAKTMLWVKMFKFFDANPGSGMRKKFGSGIRDKHQGSATLDKTFFAF
jgi:hypothetical protein